MAKEQQDLRDKLFLGGPPPLEDFIFKIVELVREDMSEKQEKDHANS